MTLRLPFRASRTSTSPASSAPSAAGERASRAPATRRLDQLCEFAPTSGPREELVLWFVDLVAWLRPAAGDDAGPRVRMLRAVLDRHPPFRERVATALARLVRGADVETLLAHGGIPREFHLVGAVREWLGRRLLPTALDGEDPSAALGVALEERDGVWIETSGVVELVGELLPAESRAALVRASERALVDLAHQITAQAHSPAIRGLSVAARSPFRGLYDAAFVLVAQPDEEGALRGVRGRVDQCLGAIGAYRSLLAERGADLNTTFQLARLSQQLRRLGGLAAVLHAGGGEAAAKTAAAVASSVARSARGDLLFARSADLVVENLVDTAAVVGERYLGDERSSFRAAFLAGCGGGAIMVVATALKLTLSRLHLPTLYEGLVFALNYGAAFCAAYLLHFTIATKLPAHTATTLARAVQTNEGLRVRLARLSSVWRATVRLQVAGLLGNVVVAGPLSWGFGVAFQAATGHAFLTHEKALHVLEAHHVLGPSVLFAALTGVFLWVSSLVTALVDNWTRVVGLESRLGTRLSVARLAGAAREKARARAAKVASKLGGLSGNAALGALLGFVPALALEARLPVDIRHVTVSTGATALALAEGHHEPGLVAAALAGVVAVGLVNVATSFALALWFALRAVRKLRPRPTTGPLVRLGLVPWWPRWRSRRTGARA